ncbi:arrestin domain-containing protein 3-like [Liolophura sinensis]|uniref:arrestin domain-containing protein 3-like n=1 Tax=Liolophura sinensis TaxID=3198878 RepID=UPI0031580F2D
MPKLRELSVVVTSSQSSVFFSGQVVQGHVVVDLEESMRMRGLRVHMSGRADVHWSERHTTGSGKNRRSHTRHYRSHEVYLNQIIVLYGKAPDQGGDNPEHPAGRYTYPFQFQIPSTAPSSFEGGIGKVRYHIAAVIDKPWKFDDKSVVAITVVNLLDLNREPQTMLGIHGENSKTLCCLCCESGPITASFKLNRQGYVPGEHIPCFAEICNNANKKMDNSFIKLVQVILFKACRKTRRVVRELQRLRKGEIPPGGTETWSGETIRLPSIPPSRLQGCNIIDIEYYIVLVVDPSGLSFDLTVALEIIVGSIPHWSIAQQYNPQAAPSAPMPQGGQDTDPPPIAFPDCMPPPSYAECVGGKVNIRGTENWEHTRGNEEYSPQYPYYDWGTPYNPEGVMVEGYRPQPLPAEESTE